MQFGRQVKIVLNSFCYAYCNIAVLTQAGEVPAMKYSEFKKPFGKVAKCLQEPNQVQLLSEIKLWITTNPDE